jgi:hypothetical protein
MREIRTSGSVEGVVGNHDSYSDSGVGLRPPSFAPLRTASPAGPRPPSGLTPPPPRCLGARECFSSKGTLLINDY